MPGRPRQHWPGHSSKPHLVRAAAEAVWMPEQTVALPFACEFSPGSLAFSELNTQHRGLTLSPRLHLLHLLGVEDASSCCPQAPSPQLCPSRRGAEVAWVRVTLLPKHPQLSLDILPHRVLEVGPGPRFPCPSRTQTESVLVRPQAGE